MNEENDGANTEDETDDAPRAGWCWTPVTAREPPYRSPGATVNGGRQPKNTEEVDPIPKEQHTQTQNPVPNTITDGKHNGICILFLLVIELWIMVAFYVSLFPDSFTVINEL